MNPGNMASVEEFFPFHPLTHTHTSVRASRRSVRSLELTIDPEIIKQMSESGVEGAAAIVSVKSNNWNTKTID